MLDLTTSRSIVESYIGTNFTTCPFRRENVGVPNETETWISLQDKQNVVNPTGMGESTMVAGGNLIIGIYHLRGEGTKVHRTIAQELSDLLGNQEIEGMVFQEPVFHGSPGDGENISWYQMNLVIPYTSILGQEY